MPAQYLLEFSPLELLPLELSQEGWQFETEEGQFLSQFAFSHCSCLNIGSDGFLHWPVSADGSRGGSRSAARYTRAYGVNV